MCERVDGEFVICAAARRRMARAAGPVQVPLIPLGLDPGGDHPWDLLRVAVVGDHPPPMANHNNPYRSLGYTAILDASEVGDFLQIRRNDNIVCEVAVSVFPGDAEPRVRIKRFVPNELREVSVGDDFDS